MTTQNSSTSEPASRWMFDPLHTQVEFAARHLGMMTVRGNFETIEATGSIYPDQPEASSVEVTIQTTSIHTNNPARDNDLRSSNFLETDAYPTMHFTSTQIQTTGTTAYSMTGDLTIKGQTHPATFQVVKYGEFNDPQMMGHRISYSAQATIDRRDFGLTFNMHLDGRWVVSNEVQIFIEGELVEQKPEPTV